jgi:hypothetical protein
LYEFALDPATKTPKALKKLVELEAADEGLLEKFIQ